MPVKNAGKYIIETIKSVLMQTETNWELIAVNDNSTDGSFETIDSFTIIEPRIKLLNNKGEGIISALQTGFELAKGTLISRMDADDLMPSKKLELLKTLLLEKGKGFVSTGKVEYFAKDGVKDGYLSYQNWLNSLCDNSRHWEEIFKECTVASPNWLIHKPDFENCGGFNSDLYPEDYDLVFRFYKSGLNIASVSEVTHLWRDHAERTSRNHIHYQHNTFFGLKTQYFIDLKLDSNRPLVIWGAGKKGKRLAKTLQEKNIQFSWVSNNPNRHGKEVYNEIMHSFEAIATKNNPQIIITVALREAKAEIISFLEKLDLQEGKDFYFFS